jgi:hypothetical protein
MADKNPDKGNSRTPYKMVMIITLWVDDGSEHEVMTSLAKQIVAHEIHELVDSASFKIGDSGYSFGTSVDAIEFVEKKNLH